MTRTSAIRRACFIWLVAAALIALLVTAQITLGKYGQDYSGVWSWYTGLFASPLGLVIAAAFSNPSPRWAKAPATRSLLWIAIGLSLFYVLCVAVLLLSEPLLSLRSQELFDRTAIFFAIFQGAVVGALAALIFDGR